LACDHFHGIFTLPHDLNPLWLANVPVRTTLLLQAVRETLADLLADPKYLGAQPGIMAALHTWSQTLVLHPHVHCLVTGGGLTPAGQWVAVRRGFLLPARVIRAVFRGTMLDAIRRAVARDAVVLPETRRPQPLLNLLNRLGHPTKTRWNVWIMERYRHGAGVVTSLARSLRGGPIKHARLVAYDGERVTFLSRARQEQTDAGPASPQRMTWPVADFLQRLWLHVPVPRHGWSGRMGCLIRRTLRSWRSAVPSWASRPWSCQRLSTGTRCVPSMPTRLRNGVRPAASSWCAPGSSRVAVLLPAWHRRSAPHAIRPAGEPCQGRRVRGGCQGTGHNGLCAVPRGGHGARHGHHSLTCGAGRACHRPDAVGVPQRKLHSARLKKPARAASVGGLSNKELKLTPGSVTWGASVCPGSCQAQLNSKR